VRYALVELLTALLFVLACVAFPPVGQTPLFGMIRLPSLASVPVLWVFMSGLVIGTFVDFDHFILPDSVTIGGTAAGLVFSALLPELHGEAVWWRGLMMSGCGAVAGFAVLFAIAEIGKLTFGRKRVVPPEPLSLSFSKAEDAKEPSLRLGDEDSPWEELFWRRTDRWLFECDTARLDVREWHGVTAVLHSEGLRIGDEQFSVDEVESFEATVKAYTFPREAMGFGDVKLMAAIGAFWGWQSTLFTVMAAALLGTVVGVALIVLGKRQLGSRLPFGPYLAMGSLLWVFWGSRLLEAYMMMYK
jgi:leader peptidase (prepilin peptidase)/N-methyltransferase